MEGLEKGRNGLENRYFAALNFDIEGRNIHVQNFGDRVSRAVFLWSAHVLVELSSP